MLGDSTRLLLLLRGGAVWKACVIGTLLLKVAGSALSFAHVPSESRPVRTSADRAGGDGAGSVDGTSATSDADGEGIMLMGTAPAPTNPLTLWYRQPATRWSEALIIGNGRLGGMIWGGVREEEIGLNEDTLWSGEPYDNLNTNGLAALPQIRGLLCAGQEREAQRLVEENMNGQYNESYMPLGRLRLSFPLRGKISRYRRELDLSRALARVEFEHDGVYYARETFASYPAQAVVIRITSDPPGHVTFSAALDSPLRHTTTVAAALGTASALPGLPRALIMAGRCPVHVDPDYVGRRVVYDEGSNPRGMRFEARLVASHEGGVLELSDQGMALENCSSATLILTAATSYNGPHRSPSREGKDPARQCDEYLAPLLGQPYSALREAHEADYRRLFSRVSLELGSSEEAVGLPTDARLRRYEPGADPALAGLYFQFGRYLLIASSRPGTQPANLQGIWSDRLHPPWSANWTLNCNAQINYWPVEVANLAECHRPLIDLTEQLAVDGARIARGLYGARGWVAHHNTDIWRQAGPVNGSACWSMFPVGSAWLCQHLWEHYAFSGDKAYLRRIWPLLRGAARFYLDYLMEEPKRGWLVTGPDTNFENAWRKPDGETGCTCLGATASMQMVRELFSNTGQAGRILEVDPDLLSELDRALPRLAPMQISPRTGELQEWLEDWDRTADCQVLSSWGAVCSAQITPRQTPDLADALRKIFDGGQWWKRGLVGSWQGAFQANTYARLADGETALAVLDMHLKRVVNPNLSANFSPMADWEIDGNLGLTAAIAEMLLQSHAGEIVLLPALPKAWADGSVRGLRARDGFVVDMTWRESKLEHADIHSMLGKPCRIRIGERVLKLETQAGKTYPVRQ